MCSMCAIVQYLMSINGHTVYDKKIHHFTWDSNPQLLAYDTVFTPVFLAIHMTYHDQKRGKFSRKSWLPRDISKIAS